VDEHVFGLAVLSFRVLEPAKLFAQFNARKDRIVAAPFLVEQPAAFRFVEQRAAGTRVGDLDRRHRLADAGVRPRDLFDPNIIFPVKYGKHASFP
jgi:hypothetical protein